MKSLCCLWFACPFEPSRCFCTLTLLLLFILRCTRHFRKLRAKRISIRCAKRTADISELISWPRFANGCFWTCSCSFLAVRSTKHQESHGLPGAGVLHLGMCHVMVQALDDFHCTHRKRDHKRECKHRCWSNIKFPSSLELWKINSKGWKTLDNLQKITHPIFFPELMEQTRKSSTFVSVATTEMHSDLVFLATRTKWTLCFTFPAQGTATEKRL